MRVLKRMVPAAALAVGIVVVASAQPPRGGRGGGIQFDAYSMIVNRGFNMDASVNAALAAELKLSEEQKAKLKEASEPIFEKGMELFKAYPFGKELTKEEEKERDEKRAKLSEERKKAVEGALKPEQAKRLSQINYQMMGVRAFTNKDVAAALKITNDQMERISGILEEYNKDVGEITRAGFQRGQQGNREEMQKRFAENQKKMAALGKEAEEKVNEKLTDEQKKAWKEMQGEKFDTTKLFQIPGFGGPPRKDKDK